MNPDPWLDRWLPLIAARVGNHAILELGCGPGIDTEVLARAGHHVVAIDLSASAIAEARRRAPSCEFHCQDMRTLFPASARKVNVGIASLSLHYFCWEETLALVGRVREALEPAGVLLCRVNSTNDQHYGASGHPRLEDNYYLVNGRPKRFFDRAAVDAMFDIGWRVLHIEHQLVHRYAQPKALWEIVLERAP